MKILAIVVGALVALVLIIVIVGYLLPVRHQASRERTFAAPAESVYAAVVSVGDYPSWRTGVERVEILGVQDGRPRFREVGSDGAITFVVDELEPPRRVVSRIDDPSLPFGGRWTYELTPSATGTTLRITEDGEVYNPIFRFVSRFIIGHHKTMETYLDDLARRVQGR